MEKAIEETHLNKNSLSISGAEGAGLSVCPPTHTEDVQAKRNTHKLLRSNHPYYRNIQWVRKVFRPPYIVHSLLYCSHLLKSFKFFFFSH